MRTHRPKITVMAEAFTGWGRKITAEKQVTLWGEDTLMTTAGDTH